MVEKNNKPIESALLTATLKTLQVLQTVQKQQDSVVASIRNLSQHEADLETDVNAVKTNQNKFETDLKQYHDNIIDNQNEHHDKIVQDLSQLPTVVEKLDYITSILDTLDIKEQIERQTDAINHVADVLGTRVNGVESNLSQQLAESNNNKTMAIIKQLIDGLRNMNDNTQTVAQRIETLATCLTDFRTDTQILSENVANNNSRIKSMDMRMGIVMTKDDDSMSPDSAIQLLTQMTQNQNQDDDTPNIVNHIDDHQDELETKPAMKSVNKHLIDTPQSSHADVKTEANSSATSNLPSNEASDSFESDTSSTPSSSNVKPTANVSEFASAMPDIDDVDTAELFNNPTTASLAEQLNLSSDSDILKQLASVTNRLSAHQDGDNDD